MIRAQDLRLFEITYTHFEPDRQTVIAVGRMQSDPRLETCEVVWTPVSREVALDTVKRRGLEKHRMDSIMAGILAGKAMPPIWALEWHDGTWLNADGNHRYAAAFAMGLTEIEARLIPRAIWQDYVVVGLPDRDEAECLGGFSGIGAVQ